MFKYPIRVKIRPLMDGNKNEIKNIIIGLDCVKIRPLMDGNSQLHNILFSIMEKLKSDH